MNKFLLILLILIFVQNLSAADKALPSMKKLIGSKDVPGELNLLIESLENEVSYEKILPLILNIDSYARLLNKEDIFLIGKVEIYKTLLKTNERFPKALIDENTLKLLGESIRKTQDPFIKWFLKALLQDGEALLKNPKYKDYLLQKNNGHVEQLELKKIDKKVQLIFRWVSKLNPSLTDFESIFKTEIMPSLMDCLINLEQSYYLLAAGAKLEPSSGLIKTPEELKFFSLIEMIIPKKPVRTQKSVEDILAPVTDENKPTEMTIPTPSKEDWLNEDNTPINLKNLPKPSNDADWLQDF